MSAHVAEMAALRDEVDRLDDRWVALLGVRLRMTERIGELKALVGEAPLDPARQAQRGVLVRRLACEHAVDESLVLGIFALLRDHNKARHEQKARRS